MSTPQTSAPASGTTTPREFSLGRSSISRPTNHASLPLRDPSAGSDSLDGHFPPGTHAGIAVEDHSSPQAMVGTTPVVRPPAGTPSTRSAKDVSTSNAEASAGCTVSLDGHRSSAAQGCFAVEGTTSPQAVDQSAPIFAAPAGTSSTAAAIHGAISTGVSPLPSKTDQAAPWASDDHFRLGGLVEDFPGDQPVSVAQSSSAAGDTAQPTANRESATIHAALSAATSPRTAMPESHPKVGALSGDQLPRAAMLVAGPIHGSPLADQTPPPAKGTSTTIMPTSGADEAGSPVSAIPGSMPSDLAPELADPLLALAADVLDDLEQVWIANTNRLRQLTRDVEDSDGEERGFGLTLDHPDVARLAALVEALDKAQQDATKNLTKRLKSHPLAPWLKAQKGVGDKQAARLLASIGDPYMRPEMRFEDGTVEAARPRTVSELWAYTGYHVVNFPAGQTESGSHSSPASRGKTGHPDQLPIGAHATNVGVAPKRARGQRANWSSTAKMRAYLIAESTMKQLKRTCPADEERGYATHADGCECSRYRKIYDAAREKYVDAIHHVECVRCGPKGKPAPAGSDLSRKHKQARALRIVSKEVLKDLWREARRIHLGDSEDAS